jgi:ATP-dependent DNA ligase
MAGNPYIELIESYTEDKALFHEPSIAEGKEGSVWKKLDQPYEPGKRVRHWLKRKRGIEVEAIVTGFKPGTKGRGNEHLIGAIEFSTVDAEGASRPIAWVTNWTDEDRERMTKCDGGTITLDPVMLGKKALIAGHDIAGKSGRYRHARIIKWLTD